MSIERRLFKMCELRVTDAGAGKRKISGYAAVFDVKSDLLGGWFEEVIRPGAFTNTLRTADVRCLFNHDPNLVLGRNKANTLTIREDGKGLFMECELPNTQLAKDLAESIDRRDVSQQSFAFKTLKDRWTYSDDYKEPAFRELLEVELFDVSPVTYPAYTQTDVGVRSFDLGDLKRMETEREKFLSHVRNLNPDQDAWRRLAIAEMEAA